MEYCHSMFVYFGKRADSVDYKQTRVCIRQNLSDAVSSGVSTAACLRLI